MMVKGKQATDIILLNGDIRTQDSKHPQVQAVAIAGGRILAAGNDDEIKSLAGPKTRSMDLQERLVLPGMLDTHFHYYNWALNRRNLALADVKTFAELLERVRRAAGQKEPHEWVLGQGWNEADWPEQRMPTRKDLDEVAPANPVALWRCDLHLAAVNSAALRSAGIDEQTPDPPEGVIERDAAGRPNGILREHAPNLISAAIPKPGDEGNRVALREGIPVLHSWGLTGINDIYLMGGHDGAPALRAWQRLRDGGELDLRCWSSIPCEHLQEAVALGLRTGLGDDRLRLGHVKFFADGGMGARTAWMLEPYLDAESGMPLADMAELEEAVRTADRAGLAVMIHAIGDRANRELVGIFERLYRQKSREPAEAPSPPPVPHRIEHVQMIRPEDLSRLARLNLVAGVQPHNMILDINMIAKSVGSKGQWTYTYRSMLDAGIPLMFSSDCPVCDPRPLVGIHALVTRQRADGTPAEGWYPEQRLTVEEAVRGYTLTPAAALGVADEIGSIASGKRADLVVLDRNIYQVDPMQILNARVEMTVFDGQIVFES